MWSIGVEVEQETIAPPPKKNPGSAPGRRDFFKFLRVIIPEFDQSNAFLLRWSNGHLFLLHKPHHDHTKNLLSSIQGETTFQIIAET